MLGTDDNGYEDRFVFHVEQVSTADSTIGITELRHE